MLNRSSIQESRAKCILPVWGRFNHFICIPFFSLRVYLVLFTNIILSETIDIAVKLILENEKDLEFLENELTKLFRFATSQTPSILMRKSCIKLME